MKTRFFLVLLLLFPFSSLVVSKEKGTSKEAVPSKATNKSISFLEVAKNTAEALCKKMDECSKEKIPASECVKETQEAFTQAYDRLPKEKKFEVGKEENTACVKTIEKSGCQELQTASKLPGCEYIEKLN